MNTAKMWRSLGEAWEIAAEMYEEFGKHSPLAQWSVVTADRVWKVGWGICHAIGYGFRESVSARMCNELESVFHDDAELCDEFGLFYWPLNAQGARERAIACYLLAELVESGDMPA